VRCLGLLFIPLAEAQAFNFPISLQRNKLLHTPDILHLSRHWTPYVFRAQRLLETGVIKKKPVWLDVVEAYPPIPPPPVPPTLRKGKYPHIVYPDDKEDSM